MAKYWYKNAIIYSTHVKTFMDADGDGIGDFKGMTRSLDYLSGLGITCIWLMPFFPSPNKDHGYDITDFLSVDPRYGSIGHFVEFLQAADERGIRVIIDLVLNHTSMEHPWFQEARRNPASRYRDYYIWRDEKPANPHQDVIFVHHQNGNWAFDETAGKYYYHTFYEHQADLNLSNPDVQEEIRYILLFWLRLGIAGFRMDAVPHMLKDKGHEKFDGDPFQFLKDIRSFIEHQRPDAILLAEVDTEPTQYKRFFGDSDQVQMLLNFYMNNHLYLALARKQATPVLRALRDLPQASVSEQMGTFVRNHDELDLERLSKRERQEVYKVFAPREDMRIYGRGIRRRVAPMLKNNRKQLELMYSLLFSLPGTPVMYYGDEIGMGEDLSLDERHSVRTTMQWSSEKNGGFSASDGKIALPVIEDGPFGYSKVNVHSQMRNPRSLLNWFERAISVRKECREFGFGDFEVLGTGNTAVAAWCCHWQNGHAIAVHNFSNKRQQISLSSKKAWQQHLVECFSDKSYKTFVPGEKMEIGPFGYRWFRKSSLFL